MVHWTYEFPICSAWDGASAPDTSTADVGELISWEQLMPAREIHNLDGNFLERYWFDIVWTWIDHISPSKIPLPVFLKKQHNDAAMMPGDSSK